MTVRKKRITVCAIALSIPLAAASCMGNSDADRIGQARGALVDLVEGEDSGAIVEHCPDEISEMRISMESGGWVIEPESMEDLEEALEDFRGVFDGQSVEMTQHQTQIDGNRARENLTFRVTDDGWDRVVPVRMDLERRDGRWVVVGIHSFD